MMKSTCLVLAVACVTGDLLAQSNSRGSGYNGALYEISSARAWGRRGAAYPGGEVGVSFQNGLCNPGSMTIQWQAPMLADHPKFSFQVARLVNDRLIQISNWSYCKHAFLSLNDPGSCGTCVNTTATQLMYVGCSDVYSNSNNGSRTYLGPPAEIDPWLGTWNPVGSYFDRGDPEVAPPANADGVRSTISVGTDAVKNRVTIGEGDLLGGTAGQLFFQIQVVHEGEPASNRDNNIMSRPFNLTWSGTSWSASTSGSPTHGSLLTRWPGATVNRGGNGNDDGRFLVAHKVTGPVDGVWHYEYAVHNLDNSRGGATFRLPVCASGQVTNLGFRDIDKNSLNDWTATVGNGEIVWTAPGTNPQNWNMLFNFWFDSNVAPVAGNATIDQARIGPGALSFQVPTDVPGLQPAVVLGGGCGTPAATLWANGIPAAGNAAFAVEVASAPSTGVFAFYSFGSTNLPLGGGCTQYLDNGSLGTHGFLVTDGAGRASIPLGVPPGFLPLDIAWQAATLIPGGPIAGSFGTSNGLLVRLAGTGCQ
jgi:hypothetical protein